MKKNGVISLVIMCTQEDLSVALKCFAEAVTNFLLSLAEKAKKSHVLYFNNHNSGSKHDFYHFINSLTPFSIYTLSYIGWFVSSLHSKNFKIPFQGFPIYLMF